MILSIRIYANEIKNGNTLQKHPEYSFERFMPKTTKLFQILKVR